MAGIKLDPRKLLGFKIIASGDAAATLRSPKIGVKGCPVVVADAAKASARATAKA